MYYWTNTKSQKCSAIKIFTNIMQYNKNEWEKEKKITYRWHVSIDALFWTNGRQYLNGACGSILVPQSTCWDFMWYVIFLSINSSICLTPLQTWNLLLKYYGIISKPFWLFSFSFLIQLLNWNKTIKQDGQVLTEMVFFMFGRKYRKHFHFWLKKMLCSGKK